MSIFLMYLQSSLVGMVATTWGLGVVCLVLFFLEPAWLGNATSRSILGIVGVALISGGSFYWWAFHNGEDFAVRKMAARESAIVQQVQDAQKAVDACNGGVDWDAVSGTCNSH